MKNRERKNYQQNLGNEQKHKDKKSADKPSPQYQTYTLIVIFESKPKKVEHHAGGKWLIHGPRRHKENQLQNPKPSCWLF